MKLFTKTLGTILLTVVLSAFAFAGSNDTNFWSAGTSQTGIQPNIYLGVLDTYFQWWQPPQPVPVIGSYAIFFR